MFLFGDALVIEVCVCESGWVLVKQLHPAESPRSCTHCCNSVYSEFHATKLMPHIKEISPEAENNFDISECQLLVFYV